MSKYNLTYLFVLQNISFFGWCFVLVCFGFLLCSKHETKRNAEIPPFQSGLAILKNIIKSVEEMIVGIF